MYVHWLEKEREKKSQRWYPSCKKPEESKKKLGQKNKGEKGEGAGNQPIAPWIGS